MSVGSCRGDREAREAGWEARRGGERLARSRGEYGREGERGSGWAHTLKLQDVRKRYPGILVLFLLVLRVVSIEMTHVSQSLRLSGDNNTRNTTTSVWW